ncbi:hypothetical protein GQ53DRAFT_523462 [Thozetella sp. PMI_491]|nr:hypothetical protein GQ53DRAFT_523462 [Thozetella sp. PMI_491]
MKKGKQPATTTSPMTGSAATPTTLPDHPIMEYEEIMTFDSPINPQDPYGASAQTEGESSSATKKKKAVKSDKSVDLKGPMEIAGSVKSGGAVTFNGDFSVGDRIEAYGNVEVNGSLTCYNKLKSFGNVQITGNMVCVDKVKIFGKLSIVGSFECHKEIEVWGALTIDGCMKCKTLTAYASVTTVGDHSWYQAEESETVYGAKLLQRDDYQG